MATEFALLVINRAEWPIVYGPFTSRAAAENFVNTGAPTESATSFTLPANAIAVTHIWPIAITPLSAHPLTVRATYPDGGVVQVPDSLVRALVDPVDLSIPDGLAVALVVCGEAPHPAIVVGPFLNGSQADQWATAMKAVTGTHPAVCRVMALEPAVG